MRRQHYDAFTEDIADAKPGAEFNARTDTIVHSGNFGGFGGNGERKRKPLMASEKGARRGNGDNADEPSQGDFAAPGWRANRCMLKHHERLPGGALLYVAVDDHVYSALGGDEAVHRNA